MARPKQRDKDIPGTIFKNRTRYWWRVKLPGDDKAQNYKLVPTGARYPTTDINVARQIARDMLAARSADRSHATGDGTIAAMVGRYQAFADDYYRNPEGEPTGEAQRNVAYALKHLVEPFTDPDSKDGSLISYAGTPAEDFGSLDLLKIRAAMIASDLARSTINKRLNIIRRAFKKCASWQIIPASTYDSVRTVENLTGGRGLARETDPVRPVAQEHIKATLAAMPPSLAQMVELQLLTGMRPGEICGLTASQIDVSGQDWFYRPIQHKNRWRGHTREIPLVGRARKIVEARMANRPLTRPLFTPAEAQVERIAARHAVRTTPLGQGNRPGTNRKPKPRTKPGQRWNPTNYRQAILYAVKATNKARTAQAEGTGREASLIPDWYPYQLRHTAATLIRAECGLDAARAVLGHRTLEMADHYAEIDRTAAAEALKQRKIG